MRHASWVGITANMNRDEIISVLDKRLKKLGVSAAEASRRAVGNHYALRNIVERGVDPRFETLNKLVESLGLELRIVDQSIPMPPAEQTTPLCGFIGAGASVVFDQELAGDDEMPAPPGMPDGLVCLEVRGHSAYPAARDRDQVYVRSRTHEPEACIGRLVVATCEGGGNWLKILRRGDAAGTWNLESVNAAEPTMESVVLHHVAPVEWIRCRGKFRAV